MVFIYDSRSECLHSAQAKGRGEHAPRQYEFQQAWADKLARRARALEKQATSLPKRLRERLREGRLLLVIGAGASISCGLPSWAELVRKVATHVLSGKSILESEADSILAAVKFADDLPSLCQSITSLVSQRELVSSVSSVLYKSPPQLSPLLKSLADVVAKQFDINREAGHPTFALTFNYDTLLEDRLRAQQVPTIHAREIPTSPNPEVVTVIHAHGVLPRGRYNAASIVLTETDYGEVYLRDEKDPLSSLMEQGFHPLFIGFSFTDSFVRRILQQNSLRRGLVASSFLTNSDLINRIRWQFADPRDLGYDHNDERGWTSAMLFPLSIREDALKRIPSYLARWMLHSIGVEWYEAKSHKELPRILDLLLAT